MKSKLRKRAATGLLAFLFMTLVVISSILIPDKVSAASAIGSVRVDGKTTEYTSVSKLADAVSKMKGKMITIEMYSDWGNQRLCVPESSYTTLNMHGHMFNRGLTSYKSDGEVIWLGSHCTCTINGQSTSSEGSTDHKVGLYHSTSTKAKPDWTNNIRGGVIAGGYSSNGGGGIDIKSDVTLILNDVTIAGCRAEQNWGTDGYGGGIWVHGGTNAAGTIIMNNSSIRGCYAYNDGGGLYQSNHDKFILEMNNSHIDYNYCDDEGGGICVDGETITIRGNGASSVSYNENGCSGDCGGGIYLWNDDVSVSGLSISHNKGGKGGGIYTQEEGISISDCDIFDNYATDDGGGIYVNNDNTTIIGCRITGNTAKDKGNGVYVASNVDTGFDVSGQTVIKGNNNSDLYISDSSRANFSLTKGGEVYMRFASMPGSYKMVTEGKVGDKHKTPNCIRYLHSDVTGYHFSFNDAPNSRKIYLVKDGEDDSTTGDAYLPGDPTEVSVADTVPVVKGTVSGNHDGAKTQYDLIRGYFHHQKVDSDTENTDAVFYYSDGYFDADPSVYNEHLTTMTWALAMTGMYQWNVDYPYRHTAARQLMADIGVDDQNIYVNDYNVQKPGTDSIGVTIGSKDLADSAGNKTGKILIPVTVRGAGYEAEWASNVLLGDGSARNGEAQGFAEAADQVEKEIEYYLDKYDLRDELEAGNVKFWITGFSRSAATANLTSKRIIEKYACSDKAGENNEVFAYTFEAPQGGTDKAETLEDKTKYYQIHNIINKCDIVPLVGPTQMGFKRYGVDHYIPGGDAGTVKKTVVKPERVGGYSGISTVTTYADNEPLYTKKDGSQNPDYVSLREKMMDQLYAIDSTIVYDDYFHIMEMNFVPGVSIEEAGSYKISMEEFIVDFIDSFQKWSIGSRDTWAVDTVKIGEIEYNTMQQAVRESMALVFGMDAETSNGFITRASDLMSKLSMFSSDEYDMIDVWDDVIGDWHTLSASKKHSYLTFLWFKLKSTGALDYLSDSDLSKLEVNWPTLAERMLNFTDQDYETKSYGAAKMLMTGTLAGNMTRILENHYPEVDLAWARAVDSYYENELTEYTVTEPGSVEAPSAFVRVDAEDPEEEPEVKELEAGTQNKLYGNQTIILDLPDLAGEAVYYTLKDTTNDVTLKDQIYRGGIDLTIKEGNGSTSYEITAYARWHGVNSKNVTYQVKLFTAQHKLTIKSKTEGDSGSVDQVQSLLYGSGENAVAIAEETSDKFFMKWKVTDENGTDVTDLIIPKAEDQKNPSVEFTMPDPNAEDATGVDTAFAADYEITFEAIYGDKISSIKLTASPVWWVHTLEDGSQTGEYVDGLPVAGQPLAGSLTATWNEESRTISDFMWAFGLESGEETYNVLVTPGDEAYNNTAYTLAMRIPQEEDMEFASEVTVTMEGVPDDKISSVKNPEDGSVTVIINFDPTEDTGKEDLNPPSLGDDNLCRLTMEVMDVNTNEKAGDDHVYYFIKDKKMTIKAPDVQDERFNGWKWLEDPGNNFYELSMEGDTVTFQLAYDASVTELALQAQYVPVVSTVEIILDEDNPDMTPVAGEKIVGEDDHLDHVYFTVTDRYEILQSYEEDSNYQDRIRLVWSPTPIWNKQQKPYYQMYNYNTAYTAAIEYHYDLANPPYVRNLETGEVKQIESQFIYAEDLQVIINGRKATYNKSSNTAYITFPATESDTTALRSIKQPDNITGVAYGASEKTVRAMLPETAAIVVADRSINEAPISWNDLYSENMDVDEYGEIQWTAKGVVELPEGVSNDNGVDLNVSMTIRVKGADRASSPTASPKAGSYESSLGVILSTSTEGGTIHYTTDGSTATASSDVYDGRTIRITRDDVDEDGFFTIRAVTSKENMKTSNEAVYQYSFSDEITVPKGAELSYNTKVQIGVEASDVYDLEVSSGNGASIDAGGNAVASAAGTYEIKAKIKDGFKWKVKKTVQETVTEYVFEEDESGNLVEKAVETTVDKTVTETTTDDQIISFTINKMSIADAVVKAADKVYTGKAIKPALTVSVKGVTLPASVYKVSSYSGNQNVGKATVTVTGIGSCEGTAKGTFKIIPKKATIKSVKPGKKLMKIKMSSGASKTGGNRYQIQYRIKGKKAWKTVNIMLASKTIKKLKTGKRYQVRARAFKKVQGVTYYGAWSKVKTSKKIG